MENTGKSSISREMRKFFKNKNRDLHDINGTNISKLDLQESILQDNPESLILKENSLMSVFYKDLKEFLGIAYLTENYREEIRREVLLNHQYGAVHFFLIPEDLITVSHRYNPKEPPSYYSNLLDFYNSINQTSLTQGLDVRLIPFNEYDKIFDVRDKILKILENEYQI